MIGTPEIEIRLGMSGYVDRPEKPKEWYAALYVNDRPYTDGSGLTVEAALYDLCDNLAREYVALQEELEELRDGANTTTTQQS